MAAVVLLAQAPPVPQGAPHGGPQDKNHPFFKGNKKDKDDGTRYVSGVVRDPQQELVEGAVVQIKDTKTLRIRSFLTKADGRYTFHGLSSEVDYEIKAQHKGRASDVRTLSVYDSRKEPIINLQLEQKTEKN
jgi:hypothetical protein